MRLIELTKTIERNNLSNLLKAEHSHSRMYPSIRSEQMSAVNTGILPLISAVLILLYEKDNQIFICLIKRAEDGLVHGGQISLPGGKKEKEDVSIIQTALREAYEEVGVETEIVNVLGLLSDLYIPPSNFNVTPVLAYCEKKPHYIINKKEVQYVVECRLSDLLDDNNIKTTIMKYGEKSFSVPYYYVEGEIVWGATAMILTELKDIIIELKKASMI